MKGPVEDVLEPSAKSDGADSLVDTSIRRSPYDDDTEVTEVQVQV